MLIPRVMRRFYDVYSENPRDAIKAVARGLGLSVDDLYLIGSIFKSENGGFTLTDTQHAHDPGGRTIAGMTVKYNKELVVWDSIQEAEQLMLLIGIYRKYLDKVSTLVPAKMRFMLVHAKFVGFDHVIRAVQMFLNRKGLRVAVDGLYGPETERALISLSSTPSDFDSFMMSHVKDIARLEADQVMSAQKRENLVIKDLSRGYENRITRNLREMEARIEVV